MSVKILNSNDEYISCECGNNEYKVDNSTSDTILYCSKCDKEYIQINYM